ncbi:hypothetical protein StoSoilB3_18750 [Arthrobacter sp. StoSoilB3]|nr:hypothetical protein StoSoilB3_18750 [Arthrobacter sp. StoSoilB3]
MPCPKWDSNAIPGPGNTGKWRKHAESGAVRRLYGPIRGARCAHCAHPEFAFYATHNANRARRECLHNSGFVVGLTRRALLGGED